MNHLKVILLIFSILTNNTVLARFVTSAFGSSHTLLLDSEGRVWGMGENKFGQLGKVYSSDALMIIEGLPHIEVIAAISDLSVFIDVNGLVWTLGSNKFIPSNSQKTKIAFDTPTEIENLPPIKDVALRNDLIFFLDRGGKVWTLECPHRENSYAQAYTVMRANTPRLIEGLPHIDQIAIGTDHVLFLDKDGKVWGMGSNLYHQLESSGTFFAAPNHLNSPRKLKLGKLPQIIQIAAGDHHILLLDVNGEVWGMGDNSFGQLGQNESITIKLTKITDHKAWAIRASGRQSFLLGEDEKIYATGNNSFNQLGSTLGKGDTKLYSVYEFTPIPELADKNISDITTSSFHSCFVSDGEIILTNYGNKRPSVQIIENFFAKKTKNARALAPLENLGNPSEKSQAIITTTIPVSSAEIQPISAREVPNFLLHFINWVKYLKYLI